MANSRQLGASVGKGTTGTPTFANPNGSQSPFTISQGVSFVVTDISIQRLSVLGTPGLFDVALRQNTGTEGTTNRWAFTGQISQNFERSFTTGIKFSTPFVVVNGSQSADGIVVRLWGFFE